MSNGRRRLLIISLVCSLAINLLLVGGIIGRLAFGPPPPPMPMHLGWLVRSLDKDTREKLRPELLEHARKVRPLRHEMRNAQEQFEAAMASPTLDEKRLDASLTQLRDASDAYQQSMHEEMVSILKRMNPEERKRVVEFLQHRGDRMHHGAGRRGKYGGEDDDRRPPPPPPDGTMDEPGPG